ncbi:MAG: hypothetical protein RIT81_40790 [Deltaproteobacteria bacterium]
MTDLIELIERFNEDNDDFAIAMNFLVAGVTPIQACIERVQAGDQDLSPHREALGEAQQLLTFAAERVGDGNVRAFALRYRGFAKALVDAL